MAPERFSARASASLAQRIRDGDGAAEEEFARLYHTRVFLMMLARTRERESANDLTQDVLVTALEAVRNGRLRKGESLAAFVHGTGRNLANAYLRDRRRNTRPVLPYQESPAPGPAEDLESSERRAVVRRCLEQLSSLDRRILLLTLVEGLKPGEIARRLDLTPEVVRQRKSRAVKEIHKSVQGMSQK